MVVTYSLSHAKNKNKINFLKKMKKRKKGETKHIGLFLNGTSI